MRMSCCERSSRANYGINANCKSHAPLSLVVNAAVMTCLDDALEMMCNLIGDVLFVFQLSSAEQ